MEGGLLKLVLKIQTNWIQFSMKIRFHLLKLEKQLRKKHSELTIQSVFQLKRFTRLGGAQFTKWLVNKTITSSEQIVETTIATKLWDTEKLGIYRRLK